jgi:small-conductance mechanosensitive channel
MDFGASRRLKPQVASITEKSLARIVKVPAWTVFVWVNTILGNLKNAINGTYHAFDFEKYAHRYLGEFQYRFNRRFDLPGMFKRLVVATARSVMIPEHKLRLAED